MIIYIALVALAGTALWIRVAPSNAARWHVDPGTIAATDCAQLATTRTSARVTCLRDGDPVALLTALDQIALDWPRTVRLAGSAETGRITWVTRSLLWGFPDYTTAQASVTPQGARLDILARLRFGGFDQGVNAARLRAWVAKL